MKPPSKEQLRAAASGVVAGAAYLAGIITGDQTLADVTTQQWLGLVVFLGGAYGVTYGRPARFKS